MNLQTNKISRHKNDPLSFNKHTTMSVKIHGLSHSQNCTTTLVLSSEKKYQFALGNFSSATATRKTLTLLASLFASLDIALPVLPKLDR